MKTLAPAPAPGADEPADPTTAGTPATTSPETITEAAAGDDESAGTTPTPVPDEDASDDGGIRPIVIAAVVAVVLAGVVTAVIGPGTKPSADDGPEART